MLYHKMLIYKCSPTGIFTLECTDTSSLVCLMSINWSEMLTCRSRVAFCRGRLLMRLLSRGASPTACPRTAERLSILSERAARSTSAGGGLHEACGGGLAVGQRGWGDCGPGECTAVGERGKGSGRGLGEGEEKRVVGGVGWGRGKEKGCRGGRGSLRGGRRRRRRRARNEREREKERQQSIA